MVSPSKNILIIILTFLLLVLTKSSQAQESTDVIVQSGHTFDVYSVAYSPDGRTILSGSRDRTLKLWDVATGREIRTFIGHTDLIWGGVAYSPDGQKVLSGSVDKTIKLWDIMTGRVIRTFTGHNNVVSGIAFSPDGRRIASCSWDRTIKIWETETGRIIRTITGSREQLTSVAFSPDGKYVLSGGRDYKIKLWDAKTGRKNRTFSGHKNWIIQVAFSPDGKQVLSSSWDLNAKLWDVKTGREIRTLTGHKETFTGVAFSPNGKHILSGSSDKTMKLWNARTGREIRTFSGHYDAVYGVAFSPGGLRVLSAGGNDRSIKLWDTNTGRQIRTFMGRSSPVNSIAFSPDDKYFLTGSLDKTFKLWNTMTGRVERLFNGHEWHVNSVAFSPDGKKVLSGSTDMTIKIWDTETGSEIQTMTGHRGGVSRAVFSADGKQVLSSSNDNSVKLWDARTGREIRTFQGHNDGVYSVAFFPNGKHILSGSMDKTMKLWNARTGREIRTFAGHKSRVMSVAFSPDGQQVLSGSYEYPYTENIRLWNAKTGQQIRTFSGHKGFVPTLTYSPDGQQILSGSSDNTIKLWDAKSGREIRTFQGHMGLVASTDFSLDGQRFLSGSADGTSILWDINKPEFTTRFVGLPGQDYATVTHDNYYMITKNASDYAHFVKGLNIYTFENFDLIYNRPDIVVERLGKASPQLVDAYYKAYLKRLEKMGFTEDQISTDMHLPEVAFKDDLPLETSEKTLSFEVNASDTKYKLDRLNVHVNNVPIFGVRGINLKDLDTKVATIPVELTLSNKVNKIQISVHNQSGAESLKETFELLYTGPQEKPELHVVSIGISDYKNDDYNLRYAAKDAKDLAKLFSKSGTFNKIHKVILADSAATRLNILALKDKLNQTKVDDQVVLFIAGHGLLNEDYDYYFATHDIDFENPSRRGITYTELEGLLDGIPARNKLLLMDTCNSGEVDKSSLAETTNEQLASNVTFRAVGTRGLKLKEDIEVAESGLGLENSFELMKELFADLRRGSGAMVISSASGVEFALESAQWENGVFTYAVLNGLKNKTADQDNNGAVTVSELRDYVAEEVKKLTNGRQTPNSRRENLENDFVVY